MNTPREILSQLQDLSRTCETPEDGVLKALKIIGDSQNEIWQAAANQAVHHKLHGKDQTAAGFYAAILGKRDAAQPNDGTQRLPPGEAVACNNDSQKPTKAQTDQRGGSSLQ